MFELFGAQPFLLESFVCECLHHSRRGACEKHVYRQATDPLGVQTNMEAARNTTLLAKDASLSLSSWAPLLRQVLGAVL